MIKRLWDMATGALTEKIAMMILALIPKLIPYVPLILLFV